MSFLATPDGVRLRYTDRGAGARTIVLVHGWKGSHRLWDPAVHRLAERFRVVAFDNRGMGESDKPAGPYDFDVLADDLGFVLAELAVEDATLVGWSMGCSIGLQYLGRGGGRVARLVLVNGPIVLRASADFPFGVEAGQLDGYLDGLPAGWPESELAFVRESMREPDGAFSRFSFQVAMQTPLEMAMRIVRAQAELDHRAVLAALELPVLAIYGGLDPYYPTELAAWIAGHARDGRHEIFENSAHAAHHDEADRFAAVVGAFAEED
ncbi:MAG TPA: alpha/beta hydrolase [Solirubrobacterales bacterium]|nr:alpha/beta hydrolase [Solirubrobacterales bacterium]